MAKNKVLEISGNDVMAPEALTISDAMSNPEYITAWWARVKLYAQAMEALDRVVILRHDNDEKDWYFASIEEQQ